MYPFKIHKLTGIIITIIFAIVNRFCTTSDDSGDLCLTISTTYDIILHGNWETWREDVYTYLPPKTAITSHPLRWKTFQVRR